MSCVVSAVVPADRLQVHVICAQPAESYEAVRLAGRLKAAVIVTFALMSNFWALGTELFLTALWSNRNDWGLGCCLKGVLDDAQQPDDRNGDNDEHEHVAGLAFEITLLLITHNASLKR